MLSAFKFRHNGCYKTIERNPESGMWKPATPYQPLLPTPLPLFLPSSSSSSCVQSSVVDRSQLIDVALRKNKRTRRSFHMFLFPLLRLSQHSRICCAAAAAAASGSWTHDDHRLWVLVIISLAKNLKKLMRKTSIFIISPQKLEILSQKPKFWLFPPKNWKFWPEKPKKKIKSFRIMTKNSSFKLNFNVECLFSGSFFFLLFS